MDDIQENQNTPKVEDTNKNFFDHVKGVIEALLFVNEKPVTLNQIKNVLETVTPSDIKKSIEEAGAELITDGEFKQKTLERVQHNPMDAETYLMGANHVHEKCLAAGKFLYFQK